MSHSFRTFRNAAGAALLCASLLLSACSRAEEIDRSSAPVPAAETHVPVADDGVLYADALFDTSRVHTVNVEISGENWADLKANPLEKTKYQVNVTIDGETVEKVSFATKGNTSLSGVARDPDSDRYSFKINFGKYVKGQTYRGLNKVSLNNLYADATYLKDYLSYSFFRQAGVDAPLTSFVFLSINGEAHGLYLAVEDVSESYLARVKNGEGVIYKPETEELADQLNGQNGQAPEMPQGGEMPEMPQGGEMPEMPQGGEVPEMPQGGEVPEMPQGGEVPEMPQGGEMPEMPQGGEKGGRGGRGFGENAKGADLKYNGDELSAYSDIFDNSETDSSKEDRLRVIAALKALSEGRIDEALDAEEVARYFAVHNFVLNYDSYTGTMLHNYFLYERNGLLSMLPWDYNLAFGGFSGGGDATSLVNTGVDTPLSGTTEGDRPMWAWISSSDESLALYHRILDEWIAETFESGAFEKEIDALSEMLLPYVQQDASAFYTAEEFKTAVQTLKEFCLLRAESVRRQLSGSLSARTEEQKTEDKVDASSILLPAMGTQNADPGGPGGGQPPQGGQGQFPGGGQPPQGGQGQFPGGGQPPQGGQGQFPGGGQPPQGGGIPADKP